MSNEEKCMLCPRRCGVDRRKQVGFCGVPWEMTAARAALHFGEEPSVSGKNGSGTIFFSGCNLRCVFCQNRELSHAGFGKTVSPDRLAEVILSLQETGAHNINFVTPTPYSEQIADVLQKVKPSLKIPVIWNCGGYESPETLKMLTGLVDIYLPDFKYRNAGLAKDYSAAPDYFEVAVSALEEMIRQVGKPIFDGEGILKKGVIVRHLVLPGCRKDSIAVLEELAKRFGTQAFLLSLMSQYTPEFATDCRFANLHRKVTSFEYNAVLEAAEKLGFDGYFQRRESATDAMTPNFHEDSLL